MEIRGKVHEIGDVQQVTDTFKKRDLVVQYAENPQFVEYIKFEATQDRTAIFDNLNVGDEVEVSFNLRGRPWTNRDGLTSYFNSLVAWRVSKVTGSPVGAGGQSAPGPQSFDAPPTVDIAADNGKDDDLPF
ncbi:DUF3127 domain-containing protein [Parapedobacter pyrenivorans]|nr:DUF3127 domain-containing protein [Parapedobacter pyrenivorans]